MTLPPGSCQKVLHWILSVAKLLLQNRFVLCLLHTAFYRIVNLLDF